MDKKNDILYVIDVKGNMEITDKATNLILALFGGLNPANLSEDEKEILFNRFGKNILNQFNN